jgi:hypothetical protein
MSRSRLLAVLAIAVVAMTGCGSHPAAKPTAAPAAVPTATTSPGAVVGADYVQFASIQKRIGGPLMKHPLPSEQAMIVGPQYAVAFDWTTVTQQIDSEDAVALGLAGPVTAPPGSELFLAHVVAHLPRALNNILGRTVDTQLIVDGNPRSASLRFDENGLLILAVPAGASVVLSVTDSGRTQTLDLRTGMRGAGANPLFYTRWAMSYFYLYTPLRDPNRGSITIDGKLALLPWTAEHGWAPAGKAWLHFEGLLYSAQGNTPDEKFDTARSISIASGGKAYPASAGSVEISADGNAILLALHPFDVAVPVGFRSGTFRINPKVSCHGCDPGGPTTATVQLKAEPIPVEK